MALSTFAGVPGRFQIVHRRPLVVVDYAHTPDALARTLTVARALVVERGGRVAIVFGCGGDRDPGKRSEMGAIAASHADIVTITNDNPRTEDPDTIADAIEGGTHGGSASVRRIMDRAEAIGAAVATASEGDIVVIAGKGHEKEQVLGDRALPFDDVEVALAAAQRRQRRGGADR
jgi:UDP-N-acetylmuramoyl-L-alanyl-D-glutamate--2,6-diaminopimelate ligase